MKLHFPLVAGCGLNDAHNPHDVSRPGGIDVWLIEYSVSGCGTVRLPEQCTDYRIEPGTILIFRPGTPQYYQMAGKPGYWNHYWITFTPRPHWPQWLDLPEIAEGIYAVKLPETTLRKYLEDRMKSAVEISHGPLVRRNEFVMNIVEELLLYIDSVNPKRDDARMDPRIRRAMRYLCERFGENITLNKLAAACSMSPSRLSHLFRSEAGMTPMAYLQQKRMDFARDMLAMSAASIKQISAQAGFENPFYFSRVFRAHCGCSPSSFRANLVKTEKNK